MCVPGALISGLKRPSLPALFTGPRLLKLIRSRRSLAPELAMPQPSVPVWRSFSEAPTVMMFLAVPGVETVLLVGPSLPAAKTTAYSWLPAVPVRASRTMKS